MCYIRAQHSKRFKIKFRISAILRQFPQINVLRTFIYLTISHMFDVLSYFLLASFYQHDNISHYPWQPKIRDLIKSICVLQSPKPYPQSGAFLLLWDPSSCPSITPTSIPPLPTFFCLSIFLNSWTSHASSRLFLKPHKPSCLSIFISPQRHPQNVLSFIFALQCGPLR